MSTEKETQGRCSNHAPFYHVLDVKSLGALISKFLKDICDEF